MLACGLETNFNYVTTMLQLNPFFNHEVNMNFEVEDEVTFWDVTPAALSPGHKTLCLIFWQNV